MWSDLVKDKKTNETVKGLSREHFELFADGNKRSISYFSREDEPRRRPLAIILLPELDHNATGRFFEKKPYADSLMTVLTQLQPQDEISIVAYKRVFTDLSAITPYAQVLPLTSDRAKLASALSTIPNLISPRITELPKDAKYKLLFPKTKDMVDEAIRLATIERPNSQVMVIDVSADWNGEDTSPDACIRNRSGACAENIRDELAAQLLRANVVHNSLIFDNTLFVKTAFITLSPLMAAYGIHVMGDDKYFAEQTGGGALRVNTPEGMAEGLKRIVGDLTAH